MKKNIKKLIPAAIAIAATIIAICVMQRKPTPYQQNQGFVFGTIYKITYQHDNDLHEEIINALAEVNNSLSPFEKNSSITRLNNGETTIADTMLQRIIGDAVSISEQTDGAFDITVAPLVNAWGFGFKENIEIKPEKIDSIMQFVGYRKLHMTGNNITKDDSRLMLDCSAIAKGYGCDIVAQVLESHGIDNYMINIGGEIVVHGTNPAKEQWKIGVNKPIDDSLSLNEEIQTVLKLSDVAMATSGNYRNFYYRNGKKYAHTIDPRTGYPVQHELLSATVIAKRCAIADAYATSFMVMGLEKAKTFCQKHPEIEAYFIYTDDEGKNKTFFTPGLKDKTEEKQ